MSNNQCCNNQSNQENLSNRQTRERQQSRRSDSFSSFPFGVASGEVGQMFDRLFETTRAESSPRQWTPPATIWEDNAGYHVEMDLAGVKPEDLEVTMEAGRLMIAAKRSFEHEDVDMIHNERRFGEVTRSVELPDSIDAESIVAKLNEGVLRVDLQKQPEVLPRKVVVQS